MANQIWGVGKRVVKDDFKVVGLGNWKDCVVLNWVGNLGGSKFVVGKWKVRVQFCIC